MSSRPKERASTTSGRSSAPRGQGSAAKAAASKTNRGAVERMDMLKKEAPELAEKVKKGEIKSNKAVSIVTRKRKMEAMAEGCLKHADELRKFKEKRSVPVAKQ